MRKKRTFVHNPWRNHKPVKESLLKATREHTYVYMSNEEILARDLEWENRYPSMKEKVTQDHEEIDALGVNITNADMKSALSKKVEHHTTTADNGDHSSTRELHPKSGDTVSDLQTQLERILRKESRVGESRPLQRKLDSIFNGAIRVTA